MPTLHTRTTLPAAAALLSVILAPPLAAQAPNAPRRPNGFTNQQQQQAWATAKIAASPLRHEWVSIRHGDRTLRAWVTYPAGNAKAPVVLVTHEVFGLTDSTKNTADEIARMGYITVAPDMVSGFAPNGGGTPDFPAGLTGQMMTAMPDQLVNGTFDAYIGWALKLPRANGKLAMVGLSWGGGASFRYAATPGHSTALKLVCIFFDVGPPTFTQGPNRLAANNPPVSIEAVDVPVYGFYGGTDTRVMNSLKATTDAMAAAGKRYEPVVYDGADHAYMRIGEDPADTNAANKAAVKASLERLRTVLAGM